VTATRRHTRRDSDASIRRTTRIERPAAASGRLKARPLPPAPESRTVPNELLARTELWLVRHGESKGNSDGILQGQKDYPLSDLGRQQAAALAGRLRKARLTACYCSDLERAQETAEIIGALAGIEPIIDPRLREIDVGTWSGLTSKEIADRHTEEWNIWQHRRDPLHKRGGGESYRDLATRIVPAFNELASRHPGGRVLIVSHGGSLNAYLTATLGMPLEAIWRLSQDNTGLSRVQPFANPNRDGSMLPGRIVMLNDTSHLNGMER